MASYNIENELTSGLKFLQLAFGLAVVLQYSYSYNLSS